MAASAVLLRSLQAADDASATAADQGRARRTGSAATADRPAEVAGRTDDTELSPMQDTGSPSCPAGCGPRPGTDLADTRSVEPVVARQDLRCGAGRSDGEKKADERRTRRRAGTVRLTLRSSLGMHSTALLCVSMARRYAAHGHAQEGSSGTLAPSGDRTHRLARPRTAVARALAAGSPV